MEWLKFPLRLVGALVAFALYVWFAAVRSAPDVKARKDALRRGGR